MLGKQKQITDNLVIYLTKVVTIIEATATGIETNQQQSSELQSDLNIQLFDRSDSDFPTFFVHEMNECLWLWVSETENDMYDMDED